VHSLLSFCLGQFVVIVQAMAHRPITKRNRNPRGVHSNMQATLREY